MLHGVALLRQAIPQPFALGFVDVNLAFGTRAREMLVNPCGTSCVPTPFTFRVDNDDEGGDFVDVDINVVNPLQ